MFKGGGRLGQEWGDWAAWTKLVELAYPDLGHPFAAGLSNSSLTINKPSKTIKFINPYLHRSFVKSMGFWSFFLFFH